MFDEVLDEDTWSQVWTYFQFEDLAPVTRVDGAWKLEDGEVLAGPDFHRAAPGYEEACADLQGVVDAEHVDVLQLGVRAVARAPVSAAVDGQS